MDVKKNCSVKTPHSEKDSSADDHQQKTPTSEGCRSSERRRNKPEFSMPKRSDVWDNIEDVPTKGMGSLLRRKLVNDFVVNNYRYNYDINYTSGEESAFVESAEESDDFTKAKMKQQKAIKKRIKFFSKRQQKGSDSSESFDSSEESVMKAKKLILKTMCKKVHMKNSTKKPLSESLESSDNSSNAVLKSAHRKQKVICSSESDSTENQKKALKASDNSSNAVLKSAQRKQKVICSSESDSTENQKKALKASDNSSNAVLKSAHRKQKVIFSSESDSTENQKKALKASDNSSNAVLKSAHRKQKVIFSSESDSTENQKKALKAAKISLISKRKKTLQAVRSSSSSLSDSDVAGRERGDKYTMERDGKAKMLSVMKKSVKHTHLKWESSEEEDKQKIASITKKARNAGTISSEWSGSVSDVWVEDSSENSRSDRDFYLKDLPTETSSTKITGKNSDQ